MAAPWRFLPGRVCCEEAPPTPEPCDTCGDGLTPLEWSVTLAFTKDGHHSCDSCSSLDGTYILTQVYDEAWGWCCWRYIGETDCGTLFIEYQRAGSQRLLVAFTDTTGNFLWFEAVTEGDCSAPVSITYQGENNHAQLPCLPSPYPGPGDITVTPVV